MPTKPPAKPTAVSFTVSNTSTPELLRSARYNFCVSTSNQLISTLHRALGLTSRPTTLPRHGSLVGSTVGGGGTCGSTRTPPWMTQLDVIRFPLTPKSALLSDAESARAIPMPAIRTAAKTNEDDLK